MPAALLRLFSTQETSTQSLNINQTTAHNDEREQELKKTLGILGKPALSVTDLEKQMFQPSVSIETMVTSNFGNSTGNNTTENLAKPVPIAIKVCHITLDLDLT
jgi:hypothetical protein